MITMIDRKRFLELVEKHLNRNCSKAEEAELEKYYHVYGQRLFDEIDQRKIRLQISQRIMAHAKKSKYSLDEKHKRRTLLRVAASLSILLVLGMSSVLLLPIKQVKFITVASNLGEKTQVTLPDSSSVTLNAGSRITYPETFNGDTRDVQLSGEAFFKVTHNPEQPFIVSTTGLNTRVLGTSFNIKAYEDNTEVKISLATGSIQISRSETILATLEPDQQMIFDKTSENYLVETHSTSNDTFWLYNIIKLNDHSFSETLKIMERWFNIKLYVEEIDENTAKRTISGKFIDPTLEEVIQSLELLCGSKISYKKNVKL
ncbi:FecR family protein [Arenibacter aquaticus]|uniref:FecR family protein n=2 Tax=Arenibacter aquaticus TaxID=2489054 RepID=A0A430K014_9FLAO|nr:FecR family protein [Arenibacter aquaticus]